ncbi:hypothetical protein MSG28_008543 [Choristoneura fumiferana]|uniref:Uncharacterized protein n=1 Tax=Choristoneura fumiferana TaxID=7141 RepID=A0ACC0J767_CHOFU|nr:hypothetical protein MSG28_008543 [Choristoneura fumiferana]
MKLILLAFFVGVAFAAPTPLENPSGEPVEVVVNGLADGEPLEIGHIVDVKVKQVVDGEVVVASNPLHPFTAQGLAEIAEAEAATAAEAEAAAEAEDVAVIDLPVAPEVPEPEIPAVIVLPEPTNPIVVPEPIELPEPVAPIVVPEPIELPEPVAPVVVPEPIELPEPIETVVVPEPIVLPEPVAPEIIVPEPAEEVPAPAPQLDGEIFNDGTVSLTVNGPQDPGVYETLSSWVNVLLNYVNSGVQYTQQLI